MLAGYRAFGTHSRGDDKPSPSLILVGILALLLAGCGIIERATGISARKQQREMESRQLAESVQLGVMRYSDQYRETVTARIEYLLKEHPDADIRVLLLDWAFSQSTAATVIAAGPNIVTNALDMVVLAGLSRRVTNRHWPAAFTRQDRERLAREYEALESQAFRLLDPIVPPAQQDELHDLMDQWAIDNPDVVRVAYIRFADFAAVGKKAERPISPSLLGIFGLDFMSGIDPAVAQIEQTRQLAERALFYAQRLPVLLDLQIRAGAARLAETPEARSALATVGEIGAVSRSTALLSEQLPDLIARERQAAIDQVLAGLQVQQTEMTALARELRGALDAGALTAENLDAVVNSADRLMSRFEPEPGAPQGEPGRPFDITEYTAALAELNATTRELQVLLAGVDGLAPALTAQVDALTARTEALVDYAFWRLVMLVGAILLAVLVYLFVARALRRAPA